MARSRTIGLITAAIMALTSFVAIGSPALAAASVTYIYPAGQACAGFDLKIDQTGSAKAPKVFTDENGNPVRQLTAGKGFALRFTNQNTGATYSLKANGSVTKVTFNADGTQTFVTTGHNVLILFPTDIPAGPTTTVYVGRVVFNVAPDGVFTLRSTSGTSTDICAALV